MRLHLATCLISVLQLITCCNQSDSSSDQERIARTEPLDTPLPEPQIGDWLYSNKEKGQTFDQYKRSKPIKPDNERSTIYIQPIGEFTQWQDSVVDFTTTYLQIFFEMPVKKLPARSDAAPFFKGRRIFEDGSYQLLSTTVLNYLHNNMPDDGIVFLAITSDDLYGGPQYNFVFGQARAKHRVAVSSLFRHSSLAIDSSSYTPCLERIIKTSAHEIGHMFGCQHCINAICLMNGSNSLSESDARPNRLCSECHQKLQWALNFNVRRRLENLESFFLKQKLERDYLLTKQELTLMQ